MSDQNRIRTDGFSNPDSERRYRERWPDEPEIAARYEAGHQCLHCSRWADFRIGNDYGLCLNGESRHFGETTFEHFACGSIRMKGRRK